MMCSAQVQSPFYDQSAIWPGASDFKLAKNANVVRFKAGETLYVEGESAPYCYQVVSGVVKEYNTLEDGRRQVADFYGVGDLFGISELEDQLHTAEAITDCAVRCYSRDPFLKAVASCPKLSQQLLDTLMARLHSSRERMIMLGRMSAIQRVAAFLIRLSREQKATSNIRFIMSRQDIADHLGLTIETVCRALTEMKKRGVIIFESARLFSIQDTASLEEITHNSN
ncbi:helix-turn-helix domain-containing protein [Hyphococcus sp. DH-69]|uniref:helix-turn-helix domain-containing protein n=2 Tax=Hyphococcus formosus TaxID=3143534 RepID=UPI00398AC914